MRSASSMTSTSTVGDRQLAALDEVDEATGRADDDVDALAERVDLRVHRHAAVDGADPPVAHLAERPERRGDLVGELAGGHEDQRPRVAGARPGRSRASSGRPKARVLPEPVLALPQMSRPARASGMVSAWIGKGSVMPSRARAATRSAGRPSPAKVRAHWGSARFRRRSCCRGARTDQLRACTARGRRGGGSILGAAPSS